MGFLFVLIGFFYVAIRTDKLPKLRAFGLDIMDRLFVNIAGLLGSKESAQKYMWLLGGLMFVILTGNIFGLILDWLTVLSKDEWLGDYIRPIFSDFSTTLVLSLTVVIVAQITAFYMKGPRKHLVHYLFNFE